MRVDHVSIGARLEAIEAIGLQVTPSAGGGHARMHLGGVYVEISGPGRKPDGAHASAWYLRPADMGVCVSELRRRGLAVSDVTPYRGFDGRWLDSHLNAPALGNAVPVLTRRITTRPWPPPLTRPHPNGVRGLKELHVATALPQQLIALLVLLGAAQRADHAVRFQDAVEILAVSPLDAHSGPVAIVLDRGAKPPLRMDLPH